ncbi:MAG: hypothetical protein PHF13_02140 [Acholeplasmataceae bacterium]|nr:hypothetical protein [Acholeplasmataceae bacterium]
MSFTKQRISVWIQIPFFIMQGVTLELSAGAMTFAIINTFLLLISFGLVFLRRAFVKKPTEEVVKEDKTIAPTYKKTWMMLAIDAIMLFVSTLVLFIPLYGITSSGNTIYHILVTSGSGSSINIVDTVFFIVFFLFVLADAFFFLYLVTLYLSDKKYFLIKSSHFSIYNLIIAIAFFLSGFILSFVYSLSSIPASTFAYAILIAMGVVFFVFSLGHFSFETKSTSKINLHRLNVDFTFKKWKINLHSVEGKYLLLTFNKDVPYRILLCPSLDSSIHLDSEELKSLYQHDEVAVVSPLQEDSQKKESLFISMENIDSFRRIQQLLLKGMIYSDKARTDCPFCFKNLVFDERKKAYVCPDCRTEIYEDACSETDKIYYYTKISNFKPNLISKLANGFGEWMKERKSEAAYYYRNITNINEDGEIECPVCHHIHHHTH